MTIDERLEAVTPSIEQIVQAQAKAEERQAKTEERQQALTQWVELIAQMQLKTEKEIRLLGRYVRTIVLDHEEAADGC